MDERRKTGERRVNIHKQERPFYCTRQLADRRQNNLPASRMHWSKYEMPAIEYKDFAISPRPHRFQDTGEWIVRVIITKNNGSCGATRQKQFISSSTFNEKKVADHHSIQFGKEIIDGKHANLSVDNL